MGPAKKQRASRRVLGSGPQALETSAQGFGCMGITAFYGKPLEDEAAIAVMKHAFDHGVTHFDTAEVYKAIAEDGSTIYNEIVVGKAIDTIGRSNVEVATKYMPSLHGDDMTPELVVEACRASCQRLGVSSVDLYYVHRIHPKVSVEKQALAMKACKDAGLTKHVGLSEFSPDNLRTFHKICPVTAVQQEWSLVNRDLEDELVPLCRELGIGIVAYSPLCRSLLSGVLSNKEGDIKASRYPRFAAENIEKNTALVADVLKMASDRGVTPAQLSLAWVANKGEDVVPIPGTTKIAHLDDNLAARHITLSEEDLEKIAAVVPCDQFQGERYTGGGPALTFRAQM